VTPCCNKVHGQLDTFAWDSRSIIFDYGPAPSTWQYVGIFDAARPRDITCSQPQAIYKQMYTAHQAVTWAHGGSSHASSSWRAAIMRRCPLWRHRWRAFIDWWRRTARLGQRTAIPWTEQNARALSIDWQRT